MNDILKEMPQFKELYVPIRILTYKINSGVNDTESTAQLDVARDS